MRKISIIVLFLMIIVLGACSNKKDYALPNIIGMSWNEVETAIDNKLELVKEEVPTNEFYPGVVMGYENNQAGDMVKSGDKIKIKVAAEPLNALEAKSDLVLYASEVAKITGRESVNEDVMVEGGIVGTDLGIPVQVGDKMILLFGDSFSGENRQGMWTSNFLGVSEDEIFHDGITFTTFNNDFNGRILPIIEGLHQEDNEHDTNVEVTKIPTGGITIGDTVYLFYMSIRYWGAGGRWNVNYCNVVKSKVDDLANWEVVEGLKWLEADAYNFGQIYPLKDPKSDYIYLYGISGGRYSGLMVGRVKESDFLDFDKYEYLVAEDTWVMGSFGLEALKENPYHIIAADPRVGEPCATYNAYLGKYMVTYKNSEKYIIALSDTPYGPFTKWHAFDCNLYGGFTHSMYFADNGKSFYTTLSDWNKYNVYLYKVVLK